MDVVVNAGAGERGHLCPSFVWVWPLGQILRCPLLQMTPASVWPTPSWHPRRHGLAEEGEIFVQPPRGGHAKTGPSNK